MKIALIGANGKIGSRILQEALSRGHSVTGISRNPANNINNQKLTWVKTDALDSDALAIAIKGNDALISAFGIDWQKPETYHLFNNLARSLILASKKAVVKRIINVGGAGSPRSMAKGSRSIHRKVSFWKG
jgi:uncharacterized protein